MTPHSCVKECGPESSQAPAFRVARRNGGVSHQVFYLNLLIELPFVSVSDLLRNLIIITFFTFSVMIGLFYICIYKDLKY